MVLKNGDLLDELPDECLIEFHDVGFLLVDEVLQFFDPVDGFFPAVAVYFGFFLLLSEPEYLVGDGVVVLLAVGLFDELPLQFRQPVLDAIRRKGISADNGSGDVFLQGFQEGAFISENLVECLDGDILQDGFVYRPVGAVHVGGGWFQAADAAPYHGFAAVIVPMDAAVQLTALAAEDHLRKAMIAGEAAFLSGWTDVNCPATDKFSLYLHKEIFRYNGLMVILHIVLRHRAIVLDPFLGIQQRILILGI